MPQPAPARRTRPRLKRSEPALRPLVELREHPLAARLPQLGKQEAAALRADIAARGILTPLEVNRASVVLGGHERLRAAQALALEAVPTRTVSPGDEVGYMLLATLRRKHLSASQLAALALDLESVEQVREEAQTRQRANLKQHAEVASLPPRGKTRELVAELAGISARTVQDAETVRKHDAELFERVKRGELTAPLAARQVRRRVRDAHPLRAAPMPEGPFDLIYADPPWQLGYPDSPWAPESYYPTLPLGEIKALEVPAADDAVLFLWAVSSLLPEALEVMAAWGFDCKTTLVWVKDWIGPGHWVRNRHELLLLGRRGDFRPPEPEDLIDSVIEAPRGRHSEKPARVYGLLERMYPQASKLELFARGIQRPGWIAWGNEVER